MNKNYIEILHTALSKSEKYGNKSNNITADPWLPSLPQLSALSYNFSIRFIICENLLKNYIIDGNMQILK